MKQVALIQSRLKEGKDVSVCIANYKKDGTLFHSLLFISAVRSFDGRVFNYVGVQCEVGGMVQWQKEMTPPIGQAAALKELAQQAREENQGTGI